MDTALLDIIKQPLSDFLYESVQSSSGGKKLTELIPDATHFILMNKKVKISSALDTHLIISFVEQCIEDDARLEVLEYEYNMGKVARIKKFIYTPLK